MLMIHEPTGFTLGDPEKNPFPQRVKGAGLELQAAFDQFILSASGWRKIFTLDGDPESVSPDTSPEDIVLTGAAASIFAEFVKSSSETATPVLAVGVDARPTGPTLADAMIRVLLAQGCAVRYPFIAAAPEIMAYAANDPEIAGFVYVSASHNPVGYNGLKFGLDDGGVLDGDRAAGLIRKFTKLAADHEALEEMVHRAAAVAPEEIRTVYDGVRAAKDTALAEYKGFSDRIVTYRTTPAEITRVAASIRAGISEYAGGSGIGVVAEMNGSARGVSIDREYLESFGVKVLALNHRPRQIVHGIVPEGENLEPCAAALERAYARDSAYLFGYVPDNDGDRGNIVYLDRKSGTAKVLSAQEVFALACVAELTFLKYLELTTEPPEVYRKQAVVVNGPTSLRIDRIAKAFGASVHRAEVGEANVVSLARELRRGGYTVRILGEGSNGGNITHPSAVRDPIGTILGLVKLVSLGRQGDIPGLFELWLEASGQEIAIAAAEYDIGTIATTLPGFTTTDAFDKRATVDIKTEDHGLLKRCYESIFPDEWERRKNELKDRFGIFTWREINYEGKIEKHGVGSAYRSGRERGGFKILFKNDEGSRVAFIWMRGSGTEPVFRILADVEGTDPEAERFLLEWHVGMIRKADAFALETASRDATGNR